jgi:hypothetical protein
VATLAAALAACDDGDDDGGDAAPPGVTGSTTAPTVGPAPSSAALATTAPPAAGATASTAIPTVPEVGVPGLESDDVLCRAWSRFGGSFQVLAVASSFGAGGPGAVAELEVLAAASVARAYEDLLASWPDELAAERDVVAEEYLGPFARRAESALDALVDAGATEEVLDELVAAWEDALARRDPTDPEVAVAVPATAVDVVAEAAGEFGAAAVPIPEDPELRVTAEAPATEAYLAATCPDRGTLGGIEVETG